MLSSFEISKIIVTTTPRAYAQIQGINGINGFFYAFEYQQGSIVMMEVHGLPDSNEACAPNIYATHVHKGASCTGTAEEPFKNADGHFSMNNCPHPSHSGDLPPLFSFNGEAWMSFYTGRFTPNDIINRTIIIHEHSEDFKTQPSGNPGKMIACGEIIQLI